MFEKHYDGSPTKYANPVGIRPEPDSNLQRETAPVRFCFANRRALTKRVLLE
jgi:hypothetical protein